MKWAPSTALQMATVLEELTQNLGHLFTFLPQATTTSLPAFSYLNLSASNKENSALLLSAMLINNNVFFQRKIKGKWAVFNYKEEFCGLWENRTSYHFWLQWAHVSNGAVCVLGSSTWSKRAAKTALSTRRMRRWCLTALNFRTCKKII